MLDDQKKVFDDITESLINKGYDRETVNGIISEIKLSFISDKALEIQQKIRLKAKILEDTFISIYNSLINEKILKFKICTLTKILIKNTEDKINIFINAVKSSKSNKISFIWESNNIHNFNEIKKEFLLSNPTNIHTVKKDKKCLTLMQIEVFENKEKSKSIFKKKNIQKCGFRIKINKSFIENIDFASKLDLDHSFEDSEEFLDYITDMHTNPNYKIIIILLNQFPKLISNYLDNKNSMIENLSFKDSNNT